MTNEPKYSDAAIQTLRDHHLGKVAYYKDDAYPRMQRRHQYFADMIDSLLAERNECQAVRAKAEPVIVIQDGNVTTEGLVLTASIYMGAVKDIFHLRADGPPYNERSVLKDSNALRAFDHLDAAGKALKQAIIFHTSLQTANQTVRGAVGEANVSTFKENHEMGMQAYNENERLEGRTPKLQDSLDAGLRAALEAHEAYEAGRERSMTREEATDIAVAWAKAERPSYYSEPFTPHAWVIDAIMYAANQSGRTDESARVPDGWRDSLLACVDALDGATGDTDPNIDDKDLRKECPEVWVMQRLMALLAAAPKPEACALGCTDTCKANEHGCASECRRKKQHEAERVADIWTTIDTMIVDAWTLGVCNKKLDMLVMRKRFDAAMAAKE